MNVLVIGGSPKGEYSITLQTSLYIEKQNPSHSFEYFNAGSRIKSLEKDLSPAVEAIERAELIIFSYPVYTFLAPYQLHRFIELLKEKGIRLDGKLATQITTSKHFYDITAHRYIKDNCLELGAGFIDGLSADMEDLLSEKGRKQALDFFAHLIDAAENGRVEKAMGEKEPAPRIPVMLPETAAEKSMRDKRTVIVADLKQEDKALADMIESFKSRSHMTVDVVNIREFPFKGGCISCFNCAPAGKCIYKDGFDSFLRENIQTADAIVIAFGIADHSMGARFKLYDDRQFCNGHRTVTMGKPFGYLVCGDLAAEENLRTVITARAEVGGNYLAGVACDTIDPDNGIEALCGELEYAVKIGYNPPSDFYGVGGMKIFRDLIWQTQGMMRADHKFYKQHGQYDFPQKHRGKMLMMYLVGAMIANPKIKAKMGNKMNEGMIAPYKKAIEKN